VRDLHAAFCDVIGPALRLKEGHLVPVGVGQQVAPDLLPDHLRGLGPQDPAQSAEIGLQLHVSDFMLPQVKNQFCKPVCKPDAAGHGERGEMQKAGDDFKPQVGRGQRGDQRRSGTSETYVVWLITQRSRVQIPPPLPGKTAPEFISGAVLFV
jgi:hypothetical protein